MLSRKSDQTMHNVIKEIKPNDALTLDNKEIKIFDWQILHFKQKWSF